MRKTVLHVAALPGAFLFVGSVTAQESRTPLVPLPSVTDFTNGDGWGVGLGLGVEYETAYEGSDEFGVEVDPAGGTGWEIGAVATFHNGERANRDFGVNRQQSINSGISETDVDSGFRSLGINVNYRRYLNEN